MRKLFFLLLMLMVPALAAHANQSARGWCENGNTTVVLSGLNSTNVVQGSFPSCTVTVNVTGGGLATIFSDNVGTPLSNPFTATSSGQWQFYAANGHYSVVTTGGGLPGPVSYPDILLSDSSIITGGVCALAFSATPVFTASTCSAFSMTLTGNVTSSTITGGTVGQQIAISLTQGAGGPWTFAFPATVVQPPILTPTATKAEQFELVELSDTNWHVIGMGEYPWNQIDALTGTGNVNVMSVSPTITTPTIVGGTMSSPTINTPTITSPTITGTGTATLASITVTGNTTTGSLTVTNNATVGGALGVTGALTAGSLSGPFTGPSPWIDVTSPTYGAKCDGVTDDTTAFNNAISAANTNGGGTIFVPPSKVCVIAGQLTSLNQASAVTVIGILGPTNSIKKPELLFTGSTCPLVDARSSTDIKFQGISAVANNAGLAGCRFFDFEHSVATDSTGIRLAEMSIAGTAASAAGFTCLACFDNADNVEVSHVRFDSAAKYIRLANTCNVTIDKSYFVNNNVAAPLYIDGEGNAVNCSGKIGPGNFFELFSATVNAKIVDCTNGCPIPLTFYGNDVGDAPAGYNGTLFNNVSNNFVLQGNGLSGGASQLATAVSIANGATGFQAIGNKFNTFATVFNWLGTAQGVLIADNTGGANVSFQSGSASSGIVTDFTLTPNKTFVLGTFQTGSQGISINGGTALTGQVGTSSNVATAGGVGSYQFACTGTAAASNTIVLNSWVVPTCATPGSFGTPNYIAPAAGTLKNLRVFCNSGGVNASSGAVTIFDNGSGTSLTCTVGTGTTCNDTTHSASVVAGDRISTKFTTQGAETLADCNISVEKQ